MGNKMGNLKTEIFDICLSTLKQIKDERGAVYHYLNSNIPTYKGFGEAYYSRINPGVIKGWKNHSLVHQHFCVPIGEVKIVIYDNRDESPSKGAIDEIILNDNSNYNLLSIPPNLWYSFKCESSNFSLLANIINFPHKEGESINLPINSKEIPYEWNQ